MTDYDDVSAKDRKKHRGRLLGRRPLLLYLIPVALNLFHHSAEVLMKYALSATLTELERRKLGHTLSAILAEFAPTHGGIAPTIIERTVRELDRCEDLRYPDFRSSSGVTDGVVWFDRDKPATASADASHIFSGESTQL